MDEITKFEPLFGEWYADGIIGEGPAGRVYRIFRESNGVKIWSALRHIPIPADEKGEERLRAAGISDEAFAALCSDAAANVKDGVELLSSLKDNDHIIRIEEYEIVPREDGKGYDAFIRTELLTSVEELTKDGPLPLEETVRLGTDVCSAIDHFRQKGLIHRDVKPSNVLRSRTGDYKLGEFGLARTLQDPDRADSAEALSFAAPEVINGEKYGSLCDEYSLGLVMYTLLNGGRLPFAAGDSSADKERALRARLSGAELPAPEDADDQLSWIILRACSFDPAERFPNAGEMRKALLKYSRGENVAPEGWVAPAAVALPAEGSEAYLSLCPCCGMKLEEGAEVCPRCGRLLDEPSEFDDDFLEDAAPVPVKKQPKPKPEKRPRPEKQPKPARDGGKKGKKRGLALIVAACLLLLAGGLTVFFITRNKQDNGGQQASNTAKPTETVEQTAPAPDETPAFETDIPATEAPTEAPTASPTEAVTDNPTDAPTDAPTEAPTASPSPTPTPTPKPTATPTPKPSPTPTPTPKPTATPTPKPTDDPSDPVYHFSDSAFESALRSATGLTGDIHMSDLLAIDKLTLDNCGISNIRDIAVMTNLKTLNMRYNNITDISPLAGLRKLTKLKLTHNKIADISPLAGLTGLTVLDLGTNKISDISPLSNLTGLTELHLKRNSFTSLSALSGLRNLVKLSIYENNISDLTPLYGLTSLRTLRIMSLPVTQAQVDELQSHLPECEIEF